MSAATQLGGWPAPVGGDLAAGEAPFAASIGSWRLGWDPSRIEYAAWTAGSDGRAAAGSVGGVEEALGFVLPVAVRARLARLGRGVDGHPAAGGWQGQPAPGQRPRPGDPVVVDGDRLGRYDELVAAEPAARRFTVDGNTLELLGFTPIGQGDTPPPDAGGGAHPGRVAISYRIRRGEEVIFAGDDLTVVDRDARLDSDEVVREVGWVLCCNVGVPPDELTAGQRRWLADHGASMWAAMKAPVELVEGTHVSFDASDGSAPLGRIVGVVAANGAAPTGYRVRPDVAELPGHPWADSDLTQFVPAARVREAVLADVDVGLDPSRPLPYLAEVRYRTFEHDVAAAHVLRTYRRDGEVRHDLAPLDGPDLETTVTGVPHQLVTLTRGAWWQTHHDLVAVRLADDVAFHVGELVQGVHDPQPHQVTGVAANGTPQLEPVPLTERPTPMGLKILGNVDVGFDPRASGLDYAVNHGDGRYSFHRPGQPTVTLTDEDLDGIDRDGAGGLWAAVDANADRQLVGDDLEISW